MKKTIADDILKKAKEIAPRLTEYRHELHSYAEVGFELPRTTALIKDILGDFDCVTENCGRAGIVTRLGNEKGRAILLRADMDALNIREECGLPFSAHNGNMHACGHDIHTAMLLGAFEILYDYRDKIPGRVIFAFQPAEETLEGASDMIASGLLDGGVDMAMMIHVICGTDLPTGYTVVSSGGISAPSSDFFKITINGKSAHGGMPNEGCNALACAARILFLIEELPSREFSAADKVTVSVGTFNSGLAPNVIADLAELCGTARAYDDPTGERLKKRLAELSEGVARLFGCSAEFTVTSSTPPLRNDSVCSERVIGFARELFGRDSCALSDELGEGRGGSEDFAYIAKEVPSVAVAMSAGSPAEGYDYPLHNPKTLLNDDVIRRGAALLAYSALRYFDENA